MRAILAAAVLAALPALAFAKRYEVVVWGERVGDGQDAQRKLDQTSHEFATAIELDYEAGARPSDALPEIVARSAGATVRTLGGLGNFSSVSLRGSSGQHVPIFLDGVPLGQSMGGLVNLADLPLETFKSLCAFMASIRRRRPAGAAAASNPRPRARKTPGSDRSSRSCSPSSRSCP